MTFFRRRLGAWSVAWLLCQVATLSAFLPPNCCAAHEGHAAGDTTCHDTAECPMHAADGAVCPMHQTAGAVEADPHAGHMGQGAAAAPEATAAAAPSAENQCRMRGICDVPAVALSLLLSVPAILPPDAVDVAMPAAPQPAPFASRLLTPPFPHHTPPPKA